MAQKRTKKAPAKKAPAKKAPEKKAPASKGPASKAPASKGPASKGPASKGPASKGPEKKAPEKKAPASKAPEKKAPEKKAPEKKAPASKGREKKAPASKAPEKKAPASKAPEKKAPASKGPEKKARGVRRAAARPSALSARAAPEEDSSSSVEELVARLEPRAREIVSSLRGLVRQAMPEATEELKWGMPVYSHNGLLCYISAQGRRIRFGFYHERMQLTDSTGAPVGRGDMLHVKVDSLEDIQPELFSRWVQEAARLNATS